MNITVFCEMKIWCAIVIVLLFVEVTESSISFYLVDFDTGEVLTYDDTTHSVGFEHQIYGNSAQLWEFTNKGALKTAQDGRYSLNYDTVTNTTVLSTTSKTTWSIVNNKLAVVGGPSLCLDTSATKVVSCDGGANITLQLHDAELYEMVKATNELVIQYQTKIDDVTTHLNGTGDKMSKMAANLTTAGKKLKDWHSDIETFVDTYQDKMREVHDNMTIMQDHMNTKLSDIKGEMRTVQKSVQNITYFVNNRTYNFTKLFVELTNYTAITNNTIRDKIKELQSALNTKSEQGRTVPSNIYDFIVLVLLALAVVNIADITKRMITHSLNERINIQYADD